jgi:hypothetical protein
MYLNDRRLTKCHQGLKLRPRLTKNASSSDVDGRPKMALRWGGSGQSAGDGLVALLKAQGVFQARLRKQGDSLGSR